MKTYTHLSAMEAILDSHHRKVQALHALLDELSAQRDDYRRLLDYYYSEQREQDLADDAAGRIDSQLKRGVLSQDAIYDLMATNHACCIQMLELATSYLKHE